MLESSVDLLNGLFFIAMILLTAVCILGSIVAALRAVSRGTATSENIQGSAVRNRSFYFPQDARNESDRSIGLYSARRKP
jgi:hypothetical protein